MEDVFEQLRQAVEDSGETRYQISKGSGVSQGQLSKFVHGDSLTIQTAQRLADYLGLELVLRKKTKRRKP